MSDTRQILKNAFSLSAAELAAKGLGVFFSLYLMRTIGPSNFGIFSYSKALVFGFIVFVYLGFEQIGIREVARDKNKLQKYAGYIFSIRITLAIISTIVLVVFMEFFSINDSSYEQRKMVSYIYGTLIIANAFFLNWAYQAIEKMHIIAIRSVLLNLINLVGLLLFVKDENDLLIAVWIIAISNIINILWMLYHFIQNFGFPKLFKEIATWKTLIPESFGIGLIFIITNLNIIITLQILTYFGGDHQTGIFSAAYQLIVLCLIPSTILQQAFFPQIAKSYQINERNKIVSKFVLMNMFMGIFVASFLFVYSDYIILLLGSKYGETNIILKILSISVLIQYLSTCYFSPLIAWKKEKYVIWANTIGLFFVLILNIILVPLIGYIGSAIASVFYEFSALVVLMYIFSKEQKELFLKNIFKVVFVGLISFSIGYAFLNFGMNIYLNFILSITIFIFFNIYFKIIKLSELKILLKR